MEAEMMVISDDGRMPRTVATHNVERAQRRSRFNFSHLASLCLTMGILAFIFAAALLISTPNDKKSSKNNEKRSNKDQGFMVKGLFSTNYQLDNDTQPMMILNLDDMTKQLNTILHKDLVQLTDAFFVKDSSHNDKQKISCDTLFYGLMLQLHMIVRDSDSYVSKDLLEQLKIALDQVQTIRIHIRMENDQLETVDLKICHLDLADSPRMILKKTRCDLHWSRIKLVSMVGGQGSRIYDDLYASSTNVTLEEDSIYQLRIQFECDRETCELPQDIHVWIDFNDNGLDDNESRLLRRSRTNRKREGNAYYLELYVPLVDGKRIRTGNHRMRLNMGPSKTYQRECGSQDYDQQHREYMAHIIAKSTDRNIAKVIAGREMPSNPLCSQPMGRISLVLMAGERGTEIRDDQRWSNNLNRYDNDYNRHHLSVTIYEDTIYLIRIQLDCSWQLNVDQFENGCNLAQDLHVWIDRIENRPPYRWPMTSYMAQGIYDLQLYVPSTDPRYLNVGSHRMRIVVTHNQQYQSICGYQEYNETREYSVKTISRNEYTPYEDISTRPIILQDIICSTYVGKVIMVLMAGEHRTQIRDDQSQGHRTIVLFEDTVYQLRIQLDCNRAWTRDILEHSCSLVYDVNIWIDLNDDGIFDPSENAAPYRWPLHSYTPQGVYDLQVYVPRLDTTKKTNTGLHRMQLIVTMNQQYRDKCGDDDYREIREYQVSIVSRMIQSVDNRMSYLKLNDNVCSQKNGKIALVLMAGEQSTLIRDNIQLRHPLNDNQNRHHLSITLYDNTIYRIRIQLDCFPHGKGGYPDSDCNVAQDVNVILDLNDDNQFDEQKSRIPQRWPLLSSMSLGIYDLEIKIPSIGYQGIRSGSHRMQVIVASSEEYRQKCGNANHREIREYIVNIVPREISVETKRSVYCLPTNLMCSSDYYGFASIHLMGEEGSAIRDSMKGCDSINNYHDRTDQWVILFANKAYTMDIELYCIASSVDERTTCYPSQQMNVWIDWNNDGTFDDTNERIFPMNQDEGNPLLQRNHLRIFVPPMDDPNEIHRMRIVIRQDQGNYHPCHMNGYGEARDYTIKLIV